MTSARHAPHITTTTVNFDDVFFRVLLDNLDDHDRTESTLSLTAGHSLDHEEEHEFATSATTSSLHEAGRTVGVSLRKIGLCPSIGCTKRTWSQRNNVTSYELQRRRKAIANEKLDVISWGELVENLIKCLVDIQSAFIPFHRS